MGLEAVETGRCAAVVADRHRQEVVLQVGVCDARFAADETTGLKVVGGPQAASHQHPFQPDPGFGQRVHCRIQGNGFLAGVLHIGLQMVLQVFTHTAQRCYGPKAQLAQLIGIANA